MSSTSATALRANTIWLDGQFVPWQESNVHLMTHALHYGFGVFEGIRAYRTHDGRLAIFRLEEHIQRLFDSAHILMLDMPFTVEQVVEACINIVRRQKDLFQGGCYLRPVAFMGDGAMGLGAKNATRVAVAAWDWGAYLGDKGLRDGIRAKVSSYTRMHVNVNMVRGKITGQYVNSILAKREAVMAGYDEAILLDISGFVAEASGENIFMLNKMGIVKTPPLSSPILAGITRDTILKLLQTQERPVEETTFTRDAVYIGQELFFCGTAAEITPVVEVDNRKIGTGEVGPLTKWVQESYFKIVRGEDDRFKHWLTYV